MKNIRIIRVRLRARSIERDQREGECRETHGEYEEGDGVSGEILRLNKNDIEEI